MMLWRKVDQMSRGEQTTIACHEPTSLQVSIIGVRRRRRLQHLSRARGGDQKNLTISSHPALFISCSLRARHSNCAFSPPVKLGKNALEHFGADDLFDTQLFRGHFFVRRYSQNNRLFWFGAPHAVLSVDPVDLCLFEYRWQIIQQWESDWKLCSIVYNWLRIFPTFQWNLVMHFEVPVQR